MFVEFVEEDEMREKELMAQIDQLQLELSEAEWAREDAENKLEQVQAKLDEILSPNENNEKLEPDNENSLLRDALDDVFSANQIVDGDLENECSNLKEEVNELKNKLNEIGIDLTQLEEGDYYFSDYFNADDFRWFLDIKKEQKTVESTKESTMLQKDAPKIKRRFLCTEDEFLYVNLCSED